MSFPATEAIGQEPAPRGLALVQELMNTWPIGGGKRPDLLATRAEAERWLSAVGLPRAAARELDALRALRTELRALAAVDRAASAPDADAGSSSSSGSGSGSGPASVRELPARLVIAGDGTARVVPAGEGAERVASVMWLGIAAAQHAGRAPGDGQWERLKLCRNPECGSAFYDRSRNNSRVWHDVTSCGNAANLRAYRERRRQTAR